MKLSRTQDHVSVTITDEDYAQISRHLNIPPNFRARFVGKLTPTHSHLFLSRTKEGRVFSPYGKYLTIQFDKSAVGAANLEVFGMTPVAWECIGTSIRIEVPEVRAPLIQRGKRKVGSLKLAAKPVGFSRLPLEKISAIKEVERPRKRVSDEEIKDAQRVFNLAIECGYIPQFDARGRVLYFDHRVGV